MQFITHYNTVDGGREARSDLTPCHYLRCETKYYLSFYPES